MPDTPKNDHRQPVLAAIALGSNLGERHIHIRAALAALAALPNSQLRAVSPIIETEPVGPHPQGRYLNGAALLSTSLPPRELLNHLLNIEQARGRDRSADQRWGPRTLDLDLLLYGDSIINEPGLIIPHPHLHERQFVLTPLAHIAGDLVVPTKNRTVGQLAQDLASAQPPARGPAPAPATTPEGFTD